MFFLVDPPFWENEIVALGRIKDQGSDQGSRIKDQGLDQESRIKDRIKDQGSRIGSRIKDHGPCFGTNEHRRRDTDARLRQS